MHQGADIECEHCSALLDAKKKEMCKHKMLRCTFLRADSELPGGTFLARGGMLNDIFDAMNSDCALKSIHPLN